VLKVLIVLLLFVSEEEIHFGFDEYAAFGHDRGQKSGSILEARVGFVCLDGGCCSLIA
jgi:hypothetical protein